MWLIAATCAIIGAPGYPDTEQFCIVRSQDIRPQRITYHRCALWGDSPVFQGVVKDAWIGLADTQVC
jgi:hypothetical protein